MYFYNADDLSERPIKIRAREKEYAKHYLPSEVKTYWLSKEEIIAKYGPPKYNEDVPIILNDFDWHNNFNRKKVSWVD